MTTLLDQASNPQLSIRRLQVLVGHDESAVREAVASNPSTPCESLLRLLGEFPLEVLENPAMALYQLANPALFLRADPGLQADWVRHPATPAWLLEQLGASDDLAVRAGVACHPSAPPALVERLAFPGDFGDHDAEGCADAMHHPLLPPGLLFDLALAYASRDFDLDFEDAPPGHVAELLLSPLPQDEFDGPEETPIDDLWTVALSLDEEGAVSDDEGWSSLTFRDPETGSYVMASLDEGACSGGDDVALEDAERTTPRAAIGGDDLASIWASSPEELVCHPGAPWHLVRRSMDRYDSALEDAIARLDVPVDQLMALSSSPSPIVRRAVAAHPSTPATVLATLAHASEPMIRLTAARHRATPASSLALLADDESAAIRRAVAANRATPAAIRRRLAGDRRESVRKAAGCEEEYEDEEGEEDEGE